MCIRDSYKDKFTQRAFVEKISHVAKRAGAKMVYTALILYYTLAVSYTHLVEENNRFPLSRCPVWGGESKGEKVV